MAVFRLTVLKCACSATGLLIALVIAIGGCTTPTPRAGIHETDSPDNAEKWGIRFESIRLTGADHFVDFRFRVIDPVKARTLLSRKDKA